MPALQCAAAALEAASEQDDGDATIEALLEGTVRLLDPMLAALRAEQARAAPLPEPASIVS